MPSKAPISNALRVEAEVVGFIPKSPPLLTDEKRRRSASVGKTTDVPAPSRASTATARLPELLLLSAFDPLPTLASQDVSQATLQAVRHDRMDLADDFIIELSNGR